MDKNGIQVAPRREALVRRRSKNERLNDAQMETIYTVYQATRNKAKTARECGVSQNAVYRVIAHVESNLPVQKQQALAKEGAAVMKEVVTDKAYEILESISEDDLKSGRIEERNAKGEITGYRYFGPNLLQKATAIGILTDKVKVLHDLGRGVSEDVASGGLMMPETADQLLAAIKNRVSSISMLQINLRKDNPDLATRVQDVTGMEIPDGVVEELDPVAPFDNQ